MLFHIKYFIQYCTNSDILFMNFIILYEVT